MTEESRTPSGESGSRDRCVRGDWVEIEYLLLEPADRAPGLPVDTASTPLVAWVKGFALADAALGDELEVETMSGRHVHGTLSSVDPGYTHTFGSPPRELAHVGRGLRARVASYRAKHRAAGGSR